MKQDLIIHAHDQPVHRKNTNFITSRIFQSHREIILSRNGNLDIGSDTSNGFFVSGNFCTFLGFLNILLKIYLKCGLIDNICM